MTDSGAANEDLKELLLSRLVDVNKRLEKLEEGNKPELRNRKNLSKLAVVDCLSTSTAHGLPQLVQPQRLLWIPFVLRPQHAFYSSSKVLTSSIRTVS